MLTVDVQDTASVANGGGTAAISVNDESTVTNNGTVTANGMGGVGIYGTNDGFDGMTAVESFLTNGTTGIIEVNGVGGAGIRAEARVRGDINIIMGNLAGGEIHVNADEGIGMDASDRGVAINSGKIQLGKLGEERDGTFGIYGNSEKAELYNLTGAVIDGHGDDVTGMRIGDNNDQVVANRGMILLTGDRAVGMDGGSDNQRDQDFQNASGLISILGEDGIGMRVGDGTDIRNFLGQIEVIGDNAIGMKAGNGSSNPTATPAILNDRGSIVVTGPNARGIEVGNLNKNVRNLGTITALGEGAIGINAGESNFVFNRREINVTGKDVRGVAFSSSTSLDINSLENDLNASGERPLIRADGTSGGGAIAVLGGDGDEVVYNGGGDIVALGANAVAVDLGNGTNLLVNDVINHSTLGAIRGVIEVDDPSGMAVRGGDGEDTVENYGDLFGDVDLAGGNDSFLLGTLGIWTPSSPGGVIDGGSDMDGLDEDEFVLGGSGVAVAPDLGSIIGFETLRIIDDGTWSLRGESSFDRVTVEGMNIVTLEGATIEIVGSDSAAIEFVTDGELNNEGGTIDVSGTSMRGVRFTDGINVLNNQFFSGNRPLIKASGIFSAEAPGGAVIGGVDDNGGLTVNNIGGDIVGQGDSSIAVRFQAGTNTLNNLNSGAERGVIKVEDYSINNIGAAVLGGGGADTVFNAGDITGTVALQGGNDTFELDTSGTWTRLFVNEFIDGGDGEDDVVFSGTGTGMAPQLDMFTDFESLDIVGGGTWAITGNGDFADVNVVGSPSENTTVEPDGVVELDGNYTQGSDTTLAVQLGSGEQNTIEATGLITLESNTTLLLDLDPDAQGAYTILESTQTAQPIGLIGTFSNVLFNDIDPLDMDLSYMSNSLVMTVVQRFGRFASNPNQASIGSYLDAGFFTATGSFQEALAEFGKLSAAETPAALDQLSAEAYDSQTSTMLSWGRSATRVLEGRPTRCESFAYRPRPEIHSKEPCGKTGWTPWIEGVGLSGERSAGSQFLGFTNSGGGLFVGANRQFGDRWWLSGDIGTGRMGSDLTGTGTGTLQTVDVGGAAGVYLGRGYLRGIVSYSHGWHTTRRDIEFMAARATGKNSSDRISVVADGAYPFEWKRLIIEPLASLRYTHLSQGQVDESGVPGVNLQVASRSDSLFSTSLGVRLHTVLFKYRYINALLEWADGLWTPEVHMSWRRVWTGADRQLNALMPDAPAAVPAYQVAARDAKSGAEFGASLRFQPLDSRITLALEYDGFLGWADSTHHVGMTLRVPF